MKLKITLTIIAVIIAANGNSQSDTCRYSGLADTLKISGKFTCQRDNNMSIEEFGFFCCVRRTSCFSSISVNRREALSRKNTIFETSSNYTIEPDYIKTYPTPNNYSYIPPKKKKSTKTNIKITDSLLTLEPKLDEPSISNSASSNYIETDIKIPELLTTKVFPNPFSATVNIQSNQAIQRITIFNASGMMVEMITVNANTLNYQLNLGKLQVGFYFINLLINDKTVIEKVQKI